MFYLKVVKMEDLNTLLKIHLGDLYSEKNWKIQQSPISGRGVFAEREFNPGDIIFKDIPLLTGPRLREDVVVCSSCLRGDVEVRACSEGCGLPLCQGVDDGSHNNHTLHCHLLRNWHQTNFNTWNTQFYYALTAISSLFLDNNRKKLLSLLHANRGPQHGIEISMMKEKIKCEELSKEDEDQMIFCCEVLDATAFEIERISSDGDKKWSLKGLYPLAGLLNHSCCPNTRKYFSRSSSGDVMCVVATKQILAGEEISTHYCPLLWATPPRRHHLATTKHFLCSCQRCSDPTEFGTYLSAVKCLSCGSGKMIPASPLDLASMWVCDSCSAQLDAKQATLAQARLAQQVLRHQPTDPAPLPFFCQISVQVKLKNVWKCGHCLEELSYDDLKENEISVRDILSLMENLQLGECRMKGILLYHLFTTIREEERRNHNEETKNEEMEIILKDAISILKDDRTAPKEMLKICDPNK